MDKAHAIVTKLSLYLTTAYEVRGEIKKIPPFILYIYIAHNESGKAIQYRLLPEK